MSTTPEGRVKNKIKKILKAHDVWYYMPVPGGYGAPILDFICSHHGVTFGIEAKAPGKQPTARQNATMRDMDIHNIQCFVIDGEEGYERLEDWLLKVEDVVPVMTSLLGNWDTIESK